MGDRDSAQVFPVDGCAPDEAVRALVLLGLFWFWFCFVFHFFLHPVSQGALEEQLALSGDGAYNAHFGESIASLGDLDDDGFPGQ